MLTIPFGRLLILAGAGLLSPAALLIAGPVAAATAQQETLEPGARVRVTAVGYGLGAKVPALLIDVEGDGADTLVLRPDPRGAESELRLPWEVPDTDGSGEPEVRVPVAFVEKLELFRGRGTSGARVAKTAVLGAAGGAIVGLVLRALSSLPPPCIDWLDTGACVARQEEPEPASWGIVALMATGCAVAGGLYGLTPKDRWEEVPLDQLRVSFAPRRDGFAVGISVAF
jgi:hypothetical protein